MSTLFDMGDIPEQEGKSNEWYTPYMYIEAAREVMNGIDLDPASCEIANRTVKAARYYTKEDSGLDHEWKANSVWLNPPYGRVHPKLKGSTNSYQVHFMQALLSNYRAGKIEQAIALVFGTSLCMPWFHPFLDFPMCIARLGIRFNTPSNREAYFGYGNVFVYLGPHEQKFTQIFSQFGRIAKAIDIPKQPLPQPTLWDREDAI